MPVKLDSGQDVGGMYVGSKRDVWIFARPLSIAKGFTKRISEGKTAVCHLGLLVTALKFAEVKRILQEQREGRVAITLDESMGSLWELYRDKDNKNHACVTREFKMKILSDEWKFCSGTLAGRTTLTSPEIDRAGSSPIAMS